MSKVYLISETYHSVYVEEYDTVEEAEEEVKRLGWKGSDYAMVKGELLHGETEVGCI